MLDSTATFYHVLFNWIAVVLYIVSTGFFTYSLAFQKERFVRPALGVALLGLFPHALSIVIRWLQVGHGPYMAMYEVLSSMAWISVFVFLVVGWRIPKLQAAGFIVMPVCFLLMAFGLFTNPEIQRLPPSLRSIWLIIHVLFNKVAVGSMIIAFGTSVLYLLKEKQRQSGFANKSTRSDILDEYSYKFVGFGFVFWSITIAAGAIWANEAWGRYWGWDPIETWSLITWLLFGLYLHLRYSFHWQGKKAAWLMILCFISSIITLFVIPFVAGSLHAEYFQ